MEIDSKLVCPIVCKTQFTGLETIDVGIRVRAISHVCFYLSDLISSRLALDLFLTSIRVVWLLNLPVEYARVSPHEVELGGIFSDDDSSLSDRYTCSIW